jgi:hypothetical protein
LFSRTATPTFRNHIPETNSMRRRLWLAPLLLAVSGCYVAPADPNYGYAPPPYQPGGYPPPPYEPYAGAYPGYSYNNGAPMFFDGGAAVPLVLFGGEWGYYDRDRHWHHAPEGVARDLEAHRAGGGQFHTTAPPRAEPYPQPKPGQHGGQAAYRPAEQPRPNVVPFAAPPHPAAGVQPSHEEHERGRLCPPGQHC